eukprot:PhF_6_TR29147/c0_g1_i5/m.42584
MSYPPILFAEDVEMYSTPFDYFCQRIFRRSYSSALQLRAGGQQGITYASLISLALSVLQLIVGGAARSLASRHTATSVSPRGNIPTRCAEPLWFVAEASDVSCCMLVRGIERFESIS